MLLTSVLRMSPATGTMYVERAFIEDLCETICLAKEKEHKIKVYSWSVGQATAPPLCLIAAEK